MQLPSTPLPLRIITHNIRYATTSPFRGEEPWSTRLPLLISQLHYLTSAPPSTSPTIICLQEVLHPQLSDILTTLNSTLPSHLHWSSIGVHRDDGHLAGEASPILYQPHYLHPETNTTTWLSPTPSTPSKGWDAASIRIVTHGIFTHLPTSKKLAILSTHLDDQGPISRLHASEILLTLTSQYSPLPIILAGDFNSEVTQEAYIHLTRKSSGIIDIKPHTPNIYGEENTYTGFGYEDEPQKQIDFIFINDSIATNPDSPPKNWKITGYAVMPNKFNDIGVFVSDHRPVIADLELL
ncbi:hypothetical protein TWF481_009351 [Arthrobotrys musiformis]|uniref:Endonuclease/exonuclease/phosphatase domain-containing protein n=1 Tax=Arthrobotrys musiformis TaxID=47236 RepID=A0AAV9W3F0_9PEZI